MTKYSSKVDFLNSYWVKLQKSGWIALILHDWEKVPHEITNDVDYVVSGPGLVELVDTVRDHCKAHGWRMAQILEHEVGAVSCICIQKSAPFDSVSLDVTWDYRRKGMLLIGNEVLVKDAWQPLEKGFSVPSPQVEFLYRLIKTAAKNKDLASSPELVSALIGLIRNHYAECRLLVNQEIGIKMKAYQEGDGEVAYLEDLLSHSYFTKVRDGRKCGLKEVRRIWRRIVEPTGLIVSDSVGLSQDEKKRMLTVLRELFRRHHVNDGGIAFPKSWIARRMSTLVIQQKGKGTKEDFLAESSETDENLAQIIQWMGDRVDQRWSNRRD